MRQETAHEGWIEDRRRIDIKSNFENIRKHVLPGESVLDVGCYMGYLKDCLGLENYTGIDLFQEHIDLARKFHPGEDCFKVGDLFDMDDRADIVICSRVLIHIPKFEEAVKKLIRAANRLVIAIIKIEPVAVTTKHKKDGEMFYQRTFTPGMVNAAFGECKIVPFRKYSNVYKWV